MEALTPQQAKEVRQASGIDQDLQAERNRISSVESVNASQGSSISSLSSRVAGLEAFANRAAGFAALSHDHAWADLPNAGVHQNERHGVPYITAATGDGRYAPSPHENVHHAVAFLTQSAANNLYAPTPHGNAHHSPNFVPA